MKNQIYISGKDNIIFFKTTNHEWTYKIGTVIKDEPTMANLKVSLTTLHSNPAEFLDNFKVNFPARACLSYIRALNTLSQMVSQSNVIEKEYTELFVRSWTELQKAGVSQPRHLDSLTSTFETIQQTEPEELEEALDKANALITQSTNEYLDIIISERNVDKKRALAKYCNKKIPKEPKFAYMRYMIANELIANDITTRPDDKLLIKESSEEVLKDSGVPVDAKKDVEEKLTVISS